MGEGDLERVAEAERAALVVLGPSLGLLPGEGPRWAASLRPREGDFGLVFAPEFADRARAHFDEVWAERPWPSARAGQTVLRVHGALGRHLASDNRFSADFPGGYRRIAAKLLPEVAWIRWRYTAPGTETGTAYDGLARVAPDRWVWLPKPWRAAGR